MLVGFDSNIMAAFRPNVGISAGKILPKGELVTVTL